jgi:hypothetical protein
MKTAIVAMLLATAIASPSHAGEIWQPGQPLTSDNILSYVFKDRGRAKIFTPADQRREDAARESARPIIIESPPRRSRPRTYQTNCNTIREGGITDTQCQSVSY